MENEKKQTATEDTIEIPGKAELLQTLKESDPSLCEEPKSQIVIIAFDDTYYGINISSVLEILKVPSITWLPCSPDYIAGVISVRGNIQALINLKAFLKFGVSHVREQSRIVLVESGELTAGLLIDEMLDILDISRNAILPPSEQGRNLEKRYLEGTLEWDERAIEILNIDAILQAVAIEQQ